MPGLLKYVFIEFIDSTSLNYIMFTHNSVALSSLVVVQCGVLLRQPDSTGRRAFICSIY